MGEERRGGERRGRGEGRERRGTGKGRKGKKREERGRRGEGEEKGWEGEGEEEKRGERREGQWVDNQNPWMAYLYKTKNMVNTKGKITLLEE